MPGEVGQENHAADGESDAEAAAPNAPVAAPRRRWPRPTRPRVLIAVAVLAVLVASGVVYALTRPAGAPEASGPAPTTGTAARTSAAVTTTVTGTPNGANSLSPTPPPSATGAPVTGAGVAPNGAPPPPPVVANPPPSVTIPAMPTGLTATALDHATIRLEWRDNSLNEDGFYILTYPNGMLGAGANETSYDIGWLAPSSQLCVAVTAYNRAGRSASYPTGGSGWICATTAPAPPPPPPPPPVAPPAAPTGLLTATGSSSSGDLFIIAQWTDNSDNEDGFRVHVADRNFQTIEIVNVTANWSAYDRLAQAGDAYCFKVQAYNSYGESAWSPSWACRSLEPAPAAPSDVNVTAVSEGTVRIEWTDNSDNETGFRVRRFDPFGISTVPANTSSYDWTGLPAGVQVCFQVIAFNLGGQSPGVPSGPSVCATT